MAARVVMPRLSNTMEEGVILKWLKKEGDPIQWGDIIAEVETDKAVIELEVYETGVLRKIVVPEGARVPVGALVTVIAEPDEDISILLKEAKVPEKPVAIEKVEAPAAPTEMRETPGPLLASPVARALAQEKGLDLRLIKGSGPGGRITKKDVEEFLGREEARPLAAEEVEEVPLSMMRKTIAKRMAESKATVPHFYITVEVQMDQAMEMRRRLNEAEPELELSLNDLILKAVARAIDRHPQVNASYAGEVYKMSRQVHLASAVALPEGIITPVIRNCGQKGLAQIARESRELIARAREKRLKPEEYTGATFTITNLGMFHVDNFAAIINPPEGAILAVGTVGPKVVPAEEGVKVVNCMKATLSCDHRVIDGALAAQFLNELRKILENPWALAL